MPNFQKNECLLLTGFVFLFIFNNVIENESFDQVFRVIQLILNINKIFFFERKVAIFLKRLIFLFSRDISGETSGVATSTAAGAMSSVIGPASCAAVSTSIAITKVCI